MGQMYRAPRPKKFKRKQLPMARSKIDQQQNQVISNLQVKVNKLRNEIELKYHDEEMFGVEFQNATAAASIVLQNGVAQSALVSSATTRIGNEVRMTSFQLKGRILRDPTELASQTVRLILVYDKAPKGTAVTFGEVLQVNTLGNVSNVPYAPYNNDYAGNRLKILYDKMYTLSPNCPDAWNTATALPPGVDVTTISGYGPCEKLIKFKIRLDKKTNYGLATGGTIADIASGALYLLFVGSETAANANYSFSGVSRTIFTDA